MYELIQAAQNTYYIDCPVKIGLYKINEKDVCLIDSGNDKHAASKILKILQENKWSLQMIINTHSHADHIGGNAFLQERTKCKIFAPEVESAFVNYPLLEASFLYGGFACKDLQNKFLKAQKSNAEILRQDVLPKGLELLPLDGHSFSMFGIKAEDEVYFLADCLISENLLEKYQIPFLYDVEKYKESLNIVSKLKADLFIPSHADPCKDIKGLVRVNLEKIDEIIELLLKFCKNYKSFDNILKEIFDYYKLQMNFGQHVLLGSTIRSFLAYMYEKDMLEYDFSQNMLMWKEKIKGN